ncbi:MAG: hypothetical protein IJ300_01905 [Clostridia bacterium]|nr:hypothetical protein [Clostridia bacterium]
MKKRIISLLLVFCMVYSMVPCVYAKTTVHVYADVSDYVAGQAYTSNVVGRNGIGHWYYSSQLGDKAADDSYLRLELKSDQPRFAVGENGSAVVITDKTNPLVFSVDIYGDDDFTDFFLASKSNIKIAGDNPVLSNQLEQGKWNTYSAVIVGDSTTLTTHAYLNGEYISQRVVNKSSISGGELRFVIDAAGTSNKFMYIDNLKLAEIDEYVKPEWISDYISDGKIVNYYRKNCGDILGLINNKLDKKIYKTDTTEALDSEYLSEGMVLELGYQIPGFLDVKKTYIADEVQSDADQAINGLTIPAEVTENIELPTQIGTVSVSWSSNDEALMTSTGVITRPDVDDLPVTLTGTFNDGIITKTKVYNIIVKGLGKQTDINLIDAELSTNNAQIGDEISFKLKRYDDYQIKELPCTASCENPNVVIDNDNKKITSQQPGVYTITLEATQLDVECETVITFDDRMEYQVFGEEVVYTEDFEGDYDSNIIVTDAVVEDYNGSKAMHVPSSGMLNSAVFGPVENGKVTTLEDAVIEADVYVAHCVASSQSNFTIRMRDNGSSGYNFAYHVVAFLSDEYPNTLSTSADNGYSRVNSVFSLSKGSGNMASGWNYGILNHVPEVYGRSSFDKLYRLRAMVMENSFVTQVYDGDTLVYSESVPISTLDGDTASISAGGFRFVSHSTEAYVDNVVISKPEWINELKVIPNNELVELNDEGIGTMEYKVLGRSTGGNWVELDGSKYTASVVGDNVSVDSNEITVTGEGMRYIAVNTGTHYSVARIQALENASEISAACDNLTIENADAIKNDFSLPTADDCDIKWSVMENEYLVLDGNTVRVTRPSSDANDASVNIYATVYGDGFILNKTFPVCIKAEISDSRAVSEAVGEITLPTVVNSDISLPATVLDEGVSIQWESSNPSVISNTGSVTRPKADTTVRLTATYTRGTVTHTQNYIVQVSGTGQTPGGGHSRRNFLQ